MQQALRGATAHGRSARELAQPHRRTLMMRVLGTLVLSAATLLAPAAPVSAQGRQETLIVIVESGPNSMDIHGVGANRPAYQASWNLYDRLLTYGVKTLPDGSRMYDYNSLKPELAESWTLAPDGLSVTFKLRRDARFHDGTPVTAKDVKWSFDRAVTVAGFPTFQMKAGSLEKPEQFVVVDDYTFRVTFVRKDKMTMPDLAVVVPAVFNAELAKKHATAQDPWAMEWLKSNDAGSGAYKLESWKPGQETIYVRFDDWKSGPLPKIGRGVLLTGNPIVSLTYGHDLFPSPYKTDMAKAKALMAEAGFPNGLETTLSFDQGFATINEPTAVLVQESLGQVGIKTTIEKIPGSNWRNMLLKKEMPLFLNAFGGWLNYPEYFFFWNFHGQNAVFNTSSYQNPDMDRLIEAARFETDPKKYRELVRGFAKIEITDVPRVPVYQPLLDVAMQKNVKGYQYWFHRQLDYRQLSKE